VKPIHWILLAAVLVAVVLLLSPDRPVAPPLETPVGCAGALAAARFVDVYGAFAPLIALHESYAEHLFSGADVSVPPDLGGACARFPRALAELHLASVGSNLDAVEIPGPELAELRTEADGFCALFRPILEGISAAADDAQSVLREASDAGLFVRIHALSERLDDLFEATFDGLAGDELRWCFAVAFTAHTMTSRGRIDRIDEDLVTVFYGSPEATVTPFLVPAEVAEAMAGLIALCGRDLDADEASQVARWAAVVDAAFVPQSP
jgi:hypothetical protein